MVRSLVLLLFQDRDDDDAFDEPYEEYLIDLKDRGKKNKAELTEIEEENAQADMHQVGPLANGGVGAVLFRCMLLGSFRRAS